MFQKQTIKLGAVALTAVLLTLGVAAVAFGYLPDAFQPKGAMYVAAVSGADAINTTSTSFVDVPALDTTVTVPTGKVADFVIQFSGVVNSPDYMYTRARVDNSNAQPGDTQIFSKPTSSTVGASAHAFNYYLFGVAAGTHRIRIQWKGNGGQQFMSDRSMIVIANVRNP